MHQPPFYSTSASLHRFLFSVLSLATYFTNPQKIFDDVFRPFFPGENPPTKNHGCVIENSWSHGQVMEGNQDSKRRGKRMCHTGSLSVEILLKKSPRGKASLPSTSFFEGLCSTFGGV